MDWIFKASSSWDFDEIDVMDDSIIGNSQNLEGFDVDQGSGIFGNGQKRSTMSSSPPGSSKKPRGHASEQPASCLVDGCIADLSICRDYHRRHRVCETHSKTPVVTIGGKDQRFCQQCSRFHPLGEFDEVKRSCRKRLDGHNRRRRKPRAESMYLNYGSYLTDQGTKLLNFGGSPAYTTTFGSSLTWPSDKKSNQQLHVTVEQTTPSNSYACARERKFPFLLDTDSDQVNHLFSEATFQHTSASAHLLVEPKGALSLLSKHTMHHAHASESGPNNLIQPPGTALQFNGSLNQHLNPHLPLRNVTGPDSDHATNHLIGMIHFRADALLENEAAKVLSFSWE
nr:squamosa promoter-binding-like protein 13A [Tanacetum cinerariifolium]